jgi:tetratricopeptide (TPR) repeat protein
LPIPAPAADSAARLAGELTQVARTRYDGRYSRIDSDALASLVQPEEELIRAFSSGLREVSRRIRPFVLLLDTTEILISSFSRLRDVIRYSGARTVWVVAMRLEDPDDADDYSQATLTVQEVDHARLRRIPMTGFDHATVAQYMRNRLGDNLPAGVTAAAVAEMTRSIPLAVRKVVDLLALGASPDDVLREIGGDGRVSTVIHEMVKRWFKHVERDEFHDDLHQICALALLSDDHDPDLLAAMWNIDVAAIGSARLALSRRHDFIRSQGGGRMHQEERAWIRLHLLHPNRRARMRAANERAAQLLRRRLARPDLVSVEAQISDDEWTVTAVQLVWHTFWADIRAGFELLGHLLPLAYILSPRFAEALLQTASWFAPACTEDQQRVLGSLRLLAPSTPIVERLRLKFHASARQQPSDKALRSQYGVTALVAAEQYGRAVLVDDVPPGIRIDLLRLQYPAIFYTDDTELVATLQRINRAISPEMSGRLGDFIGTRATAIARRLANPPTSPPSEQVSAALHAGEIAVRFNADNSDAWWALGLCHSRQDRPEAALAAFGQALRINPSSAPLHRNRGLILLRLGRPAEALAANDEALRHEPESALGHGQRATILGRLGRDGEAIDSYRQAMHLDPNDAQYPSNLGVVLHRLGRHDDAIDAFQAAIRLNPQFPPAYGNLGEVLLTCGRHAEATAALRTALELSDNTYLEAAVLLAVLVRGEDPTEADRLCRSVVNAVGFLPSAFREAELRAISQLILGDAAGATAALRAVAAQRTPADQFQAELYELLGRSPDLDVGPLLTVWHEIGGMTQ